MNKEFINNLDNGVYIHIWYDKFYKHIELLYKYRKVVSYEYTQEYNYGTNYQYQFVVHDFNFLLYRFLREGYQKVFFRKYSKDSILELGKKTRKKIKRLYQDLEENENVKIFNRKDKIKSINIS